jgi:hypothetical protein
MPQNQEGLERVSVRCGEVEEVREILQMLLQRAYGPRLFLKLRRLWKVFSAEHVLIEEAKKACFLSYGAVLERHGRSFKSDRDSEILFSKDEEENKSIKEKVIEEIDRLLDEVLEVEVVKIELSLFMNLDEVPSAALIRLEEHGLIVDDLETPTPEEVEDEG